MTGPAGVAVKHDQIRISKSWNKHCVFSLIDDYLASRDYILEGIAECVWKGRNGHLRRRTGWATRHVGCVTGGTIKDRHLHSEAIQDKDGIRIKENADGNRRIEDWNGRFGRAVSCIRIVAVPRVDDRNNVVAHGIYIAPYV